MPFNPLPMARSFFPSLLKSSATRGRGPAGACTEKPEDAKVPSPFARRIEMLSEFWLVVGDGKPDVVTTNQNSDNISILLANGDGTFASSGFSVQAPAGPRPLVADDFNNDGKKDLAIGRGLNGIDIYLGAGNGTFSFSNRLVPGIGSFISLTAGDFNGDGKKDLAYTDGGLAVLLGNGDGTFGSVAGVAAGTLVEWAVSKDFDGDGFDDLAAANLFSNDVTISLSNGDGTF